MTQERAYRLMPGDIVCHFKREALASPGRRWLYEILHFARHSEDESLFVVYRALYGTKEVWVRPFAMFMGEVDRARYPDARQKYRFERFDAPVPEE